MESKRHDEIFQSALTGELVVKVGETSRGDDIFEPLLDHITVIEVGDSQ